MKVKSLNTSAYTLFLLLFCLQLPALNFRFYTKTVGLKKTVSVVEAFMPPPAPSFSYAGPVCKSSTVSLFPVISPNQTPNGNYTYFPNGLVINSSTGEIFPGPSQPGNYTVQYSDGTSVIVVVAPVIVPQITPQNAAICSGQSIQLTVNPLGAQGYTWTNGSNANPLIVSPTANTTYSVVIKDTYGCYYTASKLVTVTPPPSGITVNSPNVCAGSSTLLTIVSGTTNPAFTYIWQPGNISGSVCSVAPIQNTNYTLTVTSSGCSVSAVSKVTVSPAITATIDFSYPFPLCTDSGDPLPIKISGFMEGGVFSPIDSIRVDAQTGKVSLDAVAPGEYFIQYTLPPLGCRAVSTFTASVAPGMVTNMVIGPNVTITQGKGTVLSADGGGGYLWEPELGLNCTDCPNPYATPEETTQYCVTDPTNGCNKGGCITVQVVCLNTGDMSVPNAFTPNKDGRNDKFCLMGWTYCVTDFNMKIFNRWGQMVYETTDSGFCWDGTDNGQELAAGVYVYSIDANVNREKFSKKGNITIIR